ncbi:MAG: hypothetical protein JWO52_7849 [Gammaproteobacteria bacterium]|nr:hypothetical protein [Gammaproteobacteria bacterium]
MAIEAGIGQKYGFEVNNFTVPTNAGNPLDIFNILIAASVPIALQRLVITSNQSSAQTVPIILAILSGVSSGGSNTLASTQPEPQSGAAASETLSYNNTTLGTLVKTVAATFWQIFNAYEFNRKPGGLLLTPGQCLALRTPTGGIGSSFAASIEGEYIAYK